MALTHQNLRDAKRLKALVKSIDGIKAKLSKAEYNRGVKDERERCARIAEKMTRAIRPFKPRTGYKKLMPCHIAAAIRNPHVKL